MRLLPLLCAVSFEGVYTCNVPRLIDSLVHVLSHEARGHGEVDIIGVLLLFLSPILLPLPLSLSSGLLQTNANNKRQHILSSNSYKNKISDLLHISVGEKYVQFYTSLFAFAVSRRIFLLIADSSS